jgi:hypothetical protein
VHLAASIAEVCVRQFHFQYAVFTAQVYGLGDKASNGGARTNVLLNTLRRRRWWNQTGREKRGHKKPQDALLPKPLTWQATAYAEYTGRAQIKPIRSAIYRKPPKMQEGPGGLLCALTTLPYQTAISSRAC